MERETGFMDERQIIYEKIHMDMRIRYYRNQQSDVISLEIIPDNLGNRLCSSKKYEDDPIVHLKIVGDRYPGWFSQGRTMRNSESTKKLRYVDQHIKQLKDSLVITTVLTNNQGLIIHHYLRLIDNCDAVEVWSEVLNNSDDMQILEMVTSFSLGGLTPFEEGVSKENLYLHRFLSTWSKEGLHERVLLEDLQLEPSATGASANSIRFGCMGSMPVREYFPALAVEDQKMNCYWAAVLAHPSSWQLEVYRKDSSLCVSGGIGDREFGHWLKQIKQGESFQTPKAYLTVGGKSLEDTMERLLQVQNLHRQEEGEEETLPVVYNEFCTTWGVPSLTSIEKEAGVLKGRGIDYFVIDGGWNNNGVGDWEERPELYPKGILEAVDLIEENGFKPGIWFEFENCVTDSNMFREHKDWLLKRDGYPIISGERAFLDMRKEEVKESLRDSVIRFLKQNRFKYIKIDYNETIGVGCDGSESLGESLREHMECTQEFYKELERELPELVIEICASGGHRLEPSMLALGHMASCSDAHETYENPIVAAELHKLVLPARSLVWVTMRKKFNEARTMYALASGFLGLFCLSGDVSDLHDWQNKLLDKALLLYKEASPIIKDGHSALINKRNASWLEPLGYQAVIRYGKDGLRALAVIHVFGEALQDIPAIKLEGSFRIKEVLAASHINAEMEKEELKVTGADKYDGIVIVMERETAIL